MALVRSAARIARATELRNLAVDLVALRGALADAGDGGKIIQVMIDVRRGSSLRALQDAEGTRRRDPPPQAATNHSHPFRCKAWTISGLKEVAL